MFKCYSKGCKNAILVLSQIPPDKFDQRFSAKIICKKSKIPEPYTRKVLQSLVRKGFLRAVRGPGGGYTFKKHPGQISIFDIIKAIDGKDAFERCILGLSKCNDKMPCPIHKTWKKVKNHLIMEFKVKTIEDLMKIRVK